LAEILVEEILFNERNTSPDTLNITGRIRLNNVILKNTVTIPSDYAGIFDLNSLKPRPAFGTFGQTGDDLLVLDNTAITINRAGEVSVSSAARGVSSGAKNQAADVVNILRTTAKARSLTDEEIRRSVSLVKDATGDVQGVEVPGRGGAKGVDHVLDICVEAVVLGPAFVVKFKVSGFLGALVA
jgi:hypothetical protein